MHDVCENRQNLNLKRGDIQFDMFATCHFDFHIFCVTLQTESSTNIVLMQMPTRPSKPASSCVLDSLWLAVEVWEQHWGQRPCFVLSPLRSGPVWSAGAILRKAVITMMHWLTGELHRRLGNFHSAFKSASRYSKTRLRIIQWAGWGSVPASRQISQRGHKGSGAGSHTGCFSPLCFTAAVSALAPALITSRTGCEGNTEGLHFQTR